LVEVARAAAAAEGGDAALVVVVHGLLNIKFTGLTQKLGQLLRLL
jgi:hypothetical protein